MNGVSLGQSYENQNVGVLLWAVRLHRDNPELCVIPSRF